MKTVKKRSQFKFPKKRIKYNKFEKKDHKIFLMFDLKGNSTLLDSEDIEDVKHFYWYKHPPNLQKSGSVSYRMLSILYRFR